MFLSALVFPTDARLDHAAIAVVALQATDTGTLAVRALGAQDAVVAERVLVAGRDFALAEGRLCLRDRSALLGYSPSEDIPDDPLVGPRSETVELGLDLRGHGKSRSRFTGGGLVYLIVPVFFHDVTDVRFERLGNQP